MKSRFQIPRSVRHFSACGVCASLLLLAGPAAAAKPKPKKSVPFTAVKLDPTAEKVDLFTGLGNGALDAVLIPKDEKEGRVLIENKSGKPLTIKLPDAIVGVQVLKQFGAGAGGGLGGIGGGLGGAGGGLGGTGTGQAQPAGGGFGGGGLGGGGFGGGGLGGGFFSIPPDRIVRFPTHTVCLAHGKPTPIPKMRYRLVEVDDYTNDTRLQELLKLIAKNRLNQQVAQAATWHLTDNMSWQELAQKRVRHVGGVPPTPYFTGAQLLGARQLVAIATANAKKRQKTKNSDKPESAHTPTGASR